MSQGFTFMVSPIYQTHKAPFSTQVRIINGGGIDTTVYALFDSWDAPTPRGIIAGQSLISGRALANIGVPLNQSYLDPLVFIPKNSTQAIWYGQIDTVAVRPFLDCDLTAATNLTQAWTLPVLLVNVDPSTFFGANGSVGWAKPHPTFAGLQMGALGNEPSLAVVYLNASSFSGPGFVSGNASVIFFAANGTITGAQQRINTPEPSSRIKFADSLACTSIVRLPMLLRTLLEELKGS
ncbi:hypothetical protein BDQ17DRAFT_1360402 [Cyathus striatus]|nr:hypothetical protein BDQ17DRAFT_1360402 [Cyathus striatus]